MVIKFGHALEDIDGIICSPQTQNSTKDPILLGEETHVFPRMLGPIWRTRKLRLSHVSLAIFSARLS